MREEAEGPADEDDEPVREADQVKQVHEEPGDPGDEAAQVDSLDVRNSAGTSSWLNENTLTYQKTKGANNLTLLGGYTRQLTNLDGSAMTNTNFVSDITGYFDIGAGTQTGGPSIGSLWRRT